MMRLFAIIVVGLISIGLSMPADAQTSVFGRSEHYERSDRMQRLAVMAWTECIADENLEEVRNLLEMDYRSEEYRDLLADLADRRVTERCFRAMPRRYRRIELGGLPFAGGLAERLVETAGVEPLINRLSMAVIGESAQTFSYTDQVANCVVRGAPNLVANLFATDPTADEETAAFMQLAPVLDICTQNGSVIEASPLAMRSMLATASYRILAAQGGTTAE